MNPGRLAVPPVTNKFEIMGLLKSIGSLRTHSRIVLCIDRESWVSSVESNRISADRSRIQEGMRR